MKRCLFVGAGVSCAVIARRLAEQGYYCEIWEERDHVAGNCHTERDNDTNVMVHRYGPHIFHTDDTEVWAFVNQYATFKPYINRVMTTVNDAVYSLPINLHTINQFFDKTLSPKGARALINELADSAIQNPKNFEEQAVRLMGWKLYEAFFKGYTQKQWGCEPSKLPASILKRLPFRFNYDTNYFAHRYQGIPERGYTAMVAAMLDHANISVITQKRYQRGNASGFDHVIYSGSIDGYFDYEKGRLGYRTLRFESFSAEGDYQGCAVMNYGDVSIPYTRITEHKHFAPWEQHEHTICYREYSANCGEGDIPYYPIRLVEEIALLNDYIDAAQSLSGISFVGRLGTYRYLDMDVTIREALDAADQIIRQIRHGAKIPSFFTKV